MAELSQQKQFDSLVSRMRSMAEEESMGNYSRTLRMGQVAVRFLVFIPGEDQPHGYSPSVQFQDLIEEQGHADLYWKAASEIYIRREKLDSDGTAEKLSTLEAKLDFFEKILNFDAEIVG